MTNNNVLGQYYIGGRLIISHDNTNALKGVIINTNPIDYESLLTSDDKWHSMCELQKTLEGIHSESEDKLKEERNKKLEKLYSTIRDYKAKYNTGKSRDIQNNEEAVRYLQVEFPKFSSNNKQMIYNEEYTDSNKKPKDFSKYFIESGVDLDEIKKILFDNENQ